MCLAVHHASQLIGLVNRFKKDIELLQEQQQKCDKEISNIYHEIEKTVLDEDQGYKFSLKLQETLKSRRKTKFELAQLRYFLKQIGCEEFKTRVEDIKNEILEDEKIYIRDPLYKNALLTMNKEGVRNKGNK